MKQIFLEVIAKDIQDIKVLNNTEIDRIEFCHKLEVGGLTPDLKSIKEASSIAKKPIMIMLRNHCDTFEITDNQVKELIDIIGKIDRYNFTGYVFGAIKGESIDLESLEKIHNYLDEIKSEKIITFHKAFDYVLNKPNALRDLEKFKRVKTILTSGGTGNPAQNIEVLKELKSSQINILVGGGVNFTNIKTLIKNRFNCFHMGTAVRKNKNWNSKIDINSFKDLAL